MERDFFEGLAHVMTEAEKSHNLYVSCKMQTQKSQWFSPNLKAWCKSHLSPKTENQEHQYSGAGEDRHPNSLPERAYMPFPCLFGLYGSVKDWMMPILGRAIHFTQSTNSKHPSGNILTEIMFTRYLEYFDLFKLIHKVNDHRVSINSTWIIT